MEIPASIPTVLGDARMSVRMVSAGHFESKARLADAETPGSARVIEALMVRMRDGDRQAAAEFVDRYGSRIRRRIRGKLGIQLRRMFDSMDIISTLSRQLDLYVMSGNFKVADQEHLWSLLIRMADHAMVRKARVCKKVREVEHDAGRVARETVHHPHTPAQIEAPPIVEISDCMRILRDSRDQSILSLLLENLSMADIGERLGMPEVTVRKRWERIRAELRRRLPADI